MMRNIINPILSVSTICLILSSFSAQSNDETPNVDSATAAHPPIMEVISRGEYAGAKACGACHKQKYNDWAGSRHGSMLRKLYTDGNTITAPWGTAETPLTFKDSGNHQYTSYMKGDKYWVTLHDAVNSKNDLDFQIDVVGYKTTQMFLSWDEANQNYITMPFIYWDWEDSNPKQPSPDNQWTPLTSGIFFYNADGSLFTGDKLELSKRAFGFTNFCMECHSTGFEVSSWEVQDTALGNRVIPVDNTSKTVELGIACEKCHGQEQSMCARKMQMTLFSQLTNSRAKKLATNAMCVISRQYH
ncbi:multiheme c-type cytochrome [Shewanella phaeophyticola]|uniref:Multiheme c-type cytochrome n=1 Tax=Shewanella phaeophyticola TaxID=2978345 RepID=A0ABT2P5E5_9GAMM|nr:multiheme c-type cytochrome [Shewanella sp. KJ10-1]MCT8986471.1 multiheme c-type cytochrome [Shewanella sp. KJ10-1]